LWKDKLKNKKGVETFTREIITITTIRGLLLHILHETFFQRHCQSCCLFVDVDDVGLGWA